MKITVLTATFNAARTLPDCRASVAAQEDAKVEHVVIDGGSTDGTVDLLRSYGVRFISEPDRGLYDALNKGVRLASGNYIGVLGADDVYADARVLADVTDLLTRTGAASCYGDLQYVDPHDPSRVIRRWRAGPYRPGRFARGWMPPHPSFFVRRDLLQRYGAFREGFGIAADYELMLRLLHLHRIDTVYLPRVVVRMSHGGMSNRSLSNLLRKSYEDLKAWQVNGLGMPAGTIALKNVVKLHQFGAARSGKREARSGELGAGS